MTGYDFLRLGRNGLLIAAVSAGCAAVPVPTERMESSAGAIRVAQEVGATRAPEAAQYLQLARQEADQARDLVARGGRSDRARAAFLLARAQADAELAIVLTRESDSRAAARAAVERLKALKDPTQAP